METSGETGGNAVYKKIKKKKYIYIYIYIYIYSFFLNKTLYCKKNIMMQKKCNNDARKT
jgi:hypothetical protein